MSCPRPEPRSPVRDLPTETVVEIAEVVYQHSRMLGSVATCTCHPIVNKDLITCSLVSWQFSAVFQPLVFRAINLHYHYPGTYGSDRPVQILLERLSMLLVARPEIGGWIQELHIAVDTRDTDGMLEETTQRYGFCLDVLAKATALTSFGFIGSPLPWWGALPREIRGALQRVFQMKTLQKLEIGAGMIPPRVLLESISSVRDLVLHDCGGVRVGSGIVTETLDSEEPVESSQLTPLCTLRFRNDLDSLLTFVRDTPEAFANLRGLTLTVGPGALGFGLDKIQEILDCVGRRLENLDVTFDEVECHGPGFSNGYCLDLSKMTNLREMKMHCVAYVRYESRSEQDIHEVMFVETLASLRSCHDLEHLEAKIGWSWPVNGMNAAGKIKMVSERMPTFIRRLDKVLGELVDGEKYKRMEGIQLSVEPWTPARRWVERRPESQPLIDRLATNPLKEWFPTLYSSEKLAVAWLT